MHHQTSSQIRFAYRNWYPSDRSGPRLLKELKCDLIMINPNIYHQIYWTAGNRRPRTRAFTEDCRGRYISRFHDNDRRAWRNGISLPEESFFSEDDWLIKGATSFRGYGQHWCGNHPICRWCRAQKMDGKGLPCAGRPTDLRDENARFLENVYLGLLWLWTHHGIYGLPRCVILV